MNRSRLAIGLASVLLASGAAATEFEYGIEVGVGTSDNITRVPANELDETITTAGLDLRLLREGGRIDANIDVDLSFLDYQDNTFDSDVAGIANADIRYRIVPERFEWVFTDSFGQALLEPFEAATPDTLENVNYLTTGPDLTVGLGTFGSLTMLGRYSLTQYEESNLDDERLLGGIALGRELSARSKLSLNATVERVEFDESTFGSNYDRQVAFLGYEKEDARTRIWVAAGYSVIHDLNDSDSSPLFELNIARDISERSTLTLGGGVRSTDAASEIRADNIVGGGTPSRPQQISTSDPFESRDARLGWQFNAQRTTVMLSASYVEDVYERLSQLDRTSNFFHASAERAITPRISLRVEGALISSDYETVNQNDDETRFGIHLSWNVTGRLYVEAYAEKLDRESSDPLTDFEESRVFLLLAWRDQSGSSGGR